MQDKVKTRVQDAYPQGAGEERKAEEEAAQGGEHPVDELGPPVVEDEEEPGEEWQSTVLWGVPRRGRQCRQTFGPAHIRDLARRAPSPAHTNTLTSEHPPAQQPANPPESSQYFTRL